MSKHWHKQLNLKSELKFTNKMLAQIIVALLALPLVLTLYFTRQKFKDAKKIRPPGPKGLPLIGNLLQFDAKSPHTYLWRLSQKYGPIMSLRLGFRPVIVISSANLVKEIMKSHDITFSGRPVQQGTRKLSYNCQDIALSTYDEPWREMRKICTLHLFSLKHVQSFRPIREDEVSLMIKKIEENSASSKLSNLSQMMISMSSNMICRVAFGKSYGEENYEKDRFSSVVHGATAMLVGLFVSDYFPYMGWFDKLSGMYTKLEKSFQELDSFYQELIDEHLDYANRPKSMNGDMIDLLLELQRSGLVSVDLTMDRIKAVLMNVLLGGIDTTSCFIIWGMTYLMTNQHAMDKVQAEIRDYAGKRDCITEDDVPKLPYFRAVLKEIFRIYPPVPLLIPRETLQKCTLNGYEIERGTMVYLNAMAIGRDPNVWENPDDFLPERFLGTDIELKGLNPELIPFGVGRRGCPGYSMGMATVELTMANLLYKFNWELPPGMTKDDVDFDTYPGFTMHKKEPLCLVAKPVYS